MQLIEDEQFIGITGTFSRRLYKYNLHSGNTLYLEERFGAAAFAHLPKIIEPNPAHFFLIALQTEDYIRHTCVSYRSSLALPRQPSLGMFELNLSTNYHALFYLVSF